jgi:hypothetical protein
VHRASTGRPPAIAEQPEAALQRGLVHLQASEFLHKTGLYPDLQYSFKHALTHDVAYQSLLHDRRRALHARIADAIERLYRDRLAEQIERLAHHALRGEVWDRALNFFHQSGAKAFAVESGQRALAIGDTLRDLELQVTARYYLGLANQLRFRISALLSLVTT